MGQIKIGYSAVSPDPSPVWLAYELGFFKRNGLDVTEISHISGGTATAKALVAGEIDFGVLAAPAVIGTTAAGADLTMIIGLNHTLNYDFVVQPDIVSREQLKGKRLGVSGSSGSSATAIRYALRHFYQLDPDTDVTLVTIGNSEERLAALQRHEIDGTVLDPAIAIKAKKGGMVILMALADKDIPYQDDGVAVSRAYAAENPEVVRAFVKAIVEAIAFFQQPRNRDAVKQIMGQYLEINDAQYLENSYIQMSARVLQAAPYVNEAGMQTIMDGLESGPHTGLTLADVVDNSYVKELDDSGFIQNLGK